MTKDELIQELTAFVENSEDNRVSAEDAISPALAGMRLYEAPLVGFAGAEDDLFVTEFKREGAFIRSTGRRGSGFRGQRR